MKIKNIFHYIFAVLDLPFCFKLIEKWCPHKGRYDCKIWNCPAHYFNNRYSYYCNANSNHQKGVYINK